MASLSDFAGPSNAMRRPENNEANRSTRCLQSEQNMLRSSSDHPERSKQMSHHIEKCNAVTWNHRNRRSLRYGSYIQHGPHNGERQKIGNDRQPLPSQAKRGGCLSPAGQRRFRRARRADSSAEPNRLARDRNQKKNEDVDCPWKQIEIATGDAIPFRNFYAYAIFPDSSTQAPTHRWAPGRQRNQRAKLGTHCLEFRSSG